MINTAITVLYWYAVVGLVLAVAGDLFQMFRRRPSDERFFLGDTVFCMALWPAVLYFAYLEARETFHNG